MTAWLITVLGAAVAVALYIVIANAVLRWESRRWARRAIDEAGRAQLEVLEEISTTER